MRPVAGPEREFKLLQWASGILCRRSTPYGAPCYTHIRKEECPLFLPLLPLRPHTQSARTLLTSGDVELKTTCRQFSFDRVHRFCEQRKAVRSSPKLPVRISPPKRRGSKKVRDRAVENGTLLTGFLDSCMFTCGGFFTRRFSRPFSHLRL